MLHGREYPEERYVMQEKRERKCWQVQYALYRGICLFARGLHVLREMQRNAPTPPVCHIHVRRCLFHCHPDSYMRERKRRKKKMKESSGEQVERNDAENRAKEI